MRMTHFPQPHPQNRAPRVQLNGAVLAAIQSDGGQRTRAKLQTISATGGVLEVLRAFEQGDFVEIAFQTRSGPVRGMAEMLIARRADQGCLQPFRFIALDDDDHQKLRMALDSMIDRTIDSIHPSLSQAPRQF
jgi:hypothetical protein